MSVNNTRTLFIVLGIVGGLVVLAIIAAMSVFVGAYFFVRESSAVAPPTAVRASAPIELEFVPVSPPEESPVLAPVPITSP